MWANKCIWDHGFLEFGETYPNAPFKGQVGMLKTFILNRDLFTTGPAIFFMQRLQGGTEAFIHFNF